MRKPLIKLSIVATVVTILSLLYFFNPTETAIAPKCLFHAVTGLNCPGCGMQRFLHAFMHGHIVEAFRYNYILIILIPYLFFFGIERYILSGKKQERWRQIIEGRTMAIAMMIIAPGWFILRNILHI